MDNLKKYFKGCGTIYAFVVMEINLHGKLIDSLELKMFQKS